MKLVYLVGFSAEGNSGKNKATREKAKALSRIVGESNFIFIDNKRPKGLIQKVLNVLTFDIRVFWYLLFKKGDYTVIQRVLFMPLTRLLFFMKGVKVINEYHADFKEEIPLLKKSKFEKFLLYFAVYFYNLNYHLCHGIIFNHPYLKEKFDKIFKKPSIYSYNGADTNHFYPMDKNDCKNQLKIDKNEVVFLFLGSVSLWHGVDYLIHIFNDERVRNERNFKLYIVGAKDSPYVQTLKNIVKYDNIVFIPPVDTNRAKLYINASDYCMLPVKQNRTSPGSPIKLYDYIACGKPVITQGRLAGYSDEVEKHNLGWTVDFDNTALAVDRLLNIVKNNTTDYEVHNRKIAETEVSWQKRMENWVAFSENIKVKK